MFPAITTSAKRLDVPNIIRTSFRKRDNMIFGKGFLFTTNSTALSEKNFQDIPFNLSMTTPCSMFNSISSRFQVGNVLLVSYTIIAMIYLFRFCWFPYASIRRLFIKRHPLSTKQGIASLATEMSFLFNVMRWLCRELHTTIITHSEKVGAIRLSNFKASLQTYFTSFLKTLNALWHIYIIVYFDIHENPELLKEAK